MKSFDTGLTTFTAYKYFFNFSTLNKYMKSNQLKKSENGKTKHSFRIENRREENRIEEERTENRREEKRKKEKRIEKNKREEEKKIENNVINEIEYRSCTKYENKNKRYSNNIIHIITCF